MEYSQTEWDEINYRVLVLSPLQRKILELMTSFIVGSSTQGEQSHHDQKCGASLHFFRFLKMVLGWFLPQWSPLESTEWTFWGHPQRVLKMVSSSMRMASFVIRKKDLLLQLCPSMSNPKYCPLSTVICVLRGRAETEFIWKKYQSEFLHQPM